MKGLVYFPFMLKLEPMSGSGVRPLRILEGFRDAGIDIEVISGDSNERKTRIRQFTTLRLINKLDWVYVENSTMPIALTDPDHVPRHPRMDAAFWRRIRSERIPVGLFYRDIHWRFPQYSAIPLPKRLVAFCFFRIEWFQIERSVDHLFLPSEAMNEALLRPWPADRVSALPPGGLIQPLKPRPKKNQNGLSLLYVGGITPPVYDLRPLFAVAREVPMVQVVVCCRQLEWRKYGHLYEPFMSKNVTITHRSGAGLEELYDDADVVAIIWRGDPYLNFAMPVKLFEAIGWGKPVITTDGTAVAEFVRSEGVGWVTRNLEETVSLLKRLVEDQNAVRRMAQRVIEIRTRHSWRKRAETIASVLLSYRRQTSKLRRW